MGAIDFTMGTDRNGNWDTSDVKAFLRNAGGIGSGGFVNLCLSHAECVTNLYMLG